MQLKSIVVLACPYIHLSVFFSRRNLIWNRFRGLISKDLVIVWFCFLSQNNPFSRGCLCHWFCRSSTREFGSLLYFFLPSPSMLFVKTHDAQPATAAFPHLLTYLILPGTSVHDVEGVYIGSIVYLLIGWFVTHVFAYRFDRFIGEALDRFFFQLQKCRRKTNRRLMDDQFRRWK